MTDPEYVMTKWGRKRHLRGGGLRTRCGQWSNLPRMRKAQPADWPVCTRCLATPA